MESGTKEAQMGGIQDNFAPRVGNENGISNNRRDSSENGVISKFTDETEDNISSRGLDNSRNNSEENVCVKNAINVEWHSGNSGEEDNDFFQEFENSRYQPQHDSDEEEIIFTRFDSKQNDRNVTESIRNVDQGSEISATYPADCYSLMSLHGPKVGYFWFGLMVFAFQMSFLVLMILSVMNSNWRTGKVADNPWEGGLADYIATEASPLLRGAQFMSLLTFVIFADASIMDIITAVHTFPRLSMATSRDKVGCMILSCFLRFVQGVFASFVAFFLVCTSTHVIEVILNFTALNFISALDDVAFEFARLGKYGPRLEEEVKRIKGLPLPACMFQKHKHIRYWYTIIPVLMLVVGGFVSMVLLQEDTFRWETHVLRVEFGADSGLQGYSGCYRNTFKRENETWRRDFYLSDDRNEKSAKFGFCIESHNWVLYNASQPDPCNATAVVHSSKTDSFDISTILLDDWFTSGHIPADLYFFEDRYDGPNLHCDAFLNNGKCDEHFNNAFNNFDNGDCCAATCLQPTCGVGGLVNAFGSTNTTGDGYSNCLNPTMVELTIQLNSFISSRNLKFLEISEENRTYIDNFMPDFYDKLPADTLLMLYCNNNKILKYYINPSMENQFETVRVSDGATCEIHIENTTSSKPKWDDAPIWYVNYTVYHGNETSPILLQGDSFDNGVAFFDMIPKCYFEILANHLDPGINLQLCGCPSTKALQWLAENDLESAGCKFFLISRFALAALNFAAPILSSSPSGSRNGKWIEKENLDICSWRNVVCVQNLESTEQDLLHLDLSGLEISGPIATEIGLLSTLSRYDASNNALTGSVPSEIGLLTNLSMLRLKDNDVTSTIPTRIGLLTALEELFVESNHFTGSIPTEIGLLTNLVDLAVDKNNLTGSIPSEIGLLTSLTMLTIGSNHLTGSLPSEIGLLTNLTILDMKNNRLTGLIPNEICLLTSLARFSLNENYLTGSIPSEIGCLTSLTMLDIDESHLSGSIPTEVEELTASEGLFP